MTERDVEFYKEVFNLFDVNGIGALTPIDVRRALEIFGYNPQKRVVYDIIANIDTQETGEISFADFLKLVSDQKRPCDEETKDDYEFTFQCFDADDKGYITREDIKNIAMDERETLTDQELDDIMLKLDPKGTG